jgi:hypothetical protein
MPESRWLINSGQECDAQTESRAFEPGFLVKKPGFPGFFRLFVGLAAWLWERFFLKSNPCRMSRKFRFSHGREFL